MNGSTKATKQLVGYIERRVHAGKRLIKLDPDLLRDYQDDAACTSREALHWIRTHLDTALRVLEADTHFPVKVTDYYMTKFAGKEPPKATAETSRCVAGGGRASKLVAIYFAVGENDTLWLQARYLGLVSGERKAERNVERTALGMDAKVVTPERAARLAIEAKVDHRPDVRRVLGLGDGEPPLLPAL